MLTISTDTSWAWLFTQIRVAGSEDWGPGIMEEVKGMTNEKEGIMTSLALSSQAEPNSEWN